MPPNFLARLIWQESRFDIKAISPVGAQGIAQFMPGTAMEEGLADPYDPEQAIPASARLLAKHRDRFGNFGLAAAAYNAGPNRVARFVTGTSGLPFETQDYIASITGRAAAAFRAPGMKLEDTPLEKGRPFLDACRDLPVRRTRFNGTRVEVLSPWGVQVAGHFNRSRAESIWLRVRTKLGTVIGGAPPEVIRARGTMGTRKQWMVRLGAQSRNEAISLCRSIRQVGGFCLVKRNR